MSKNICPECNSELYFSKWTVTEKLYKLNENGRVSKRSFQTILMKPYEAECGVICSNPECSYTTIGSGRVK